ncbi:MAG: hypothetical protein MHM6MM_006142 [Cercozoa sp. M6MM]
MATSQPLFPGESDIDQLHRIVCELGPLPERQVRSSGAKSMCIGNSRARINTFEQRFANYLPSQARAFLRGCLNLDPEQRLTIQQCLDHPFLRANAMLPRPLTHARPPTVASSMSVKAYHHGKHASDSWGQQLALSQPSEGGTILQWERILAVLTNLRCAEVFTSARGAQKSEYDLPDIKAHHVGEPVSQKHQQTSHSQYPSNGSSSQHFPQLMPSHASIAAPRASNHRTQQQLHRVPLAPIGANASHHRFAQQKDSERSSSITQYNTTEPRFLEV